MNTLNHKTSSLVALTLASLIGTVTVYAADQPRTATTNQSTATSASPACHTEIRRVAMWPRGGAPGKGLQAPTFQKRSVMVCDNGRAMKNPPRSATAPAAPRKRN